ncbi:hypothetical protein CDAR_574161 [Caerostris darwini]|uniref:Uncharacterized protein n=1 Tax=Caerostris darwini TaxID=1538125 RepID=A0AAV4T745_9ARAC|nr:hypothetical protein CDAR_574161 [Caerostris darwini]
MGKMYRIPNLNLAVQLNHSLGEYYASIATFCSIRASKDYLFWKHTWNCHHPFGVKLNIQVDSLEFALIPSMSSSSFRMINVVRRMLLDCDVITPYRSWSGEKLSPEYSAVSTPNEVKSSAMGKDVSGEWYGTQTEIPGSSRRRLMFNL